MEISEQDPVEVQSIELECHSADVDSTDNIEVSVNVVQEGTSDQTSSETRKRKHKCPHCNLSLEAASHLKIHLRSHSGEKPFICGTCGKASARMHDIQKHMMIHSDRVPYSCLLCLKKFRSKSSFSLHAKSHGLSVSKIVACKYCPLQYENREALRAHVASEHRIKKVHTCEVCNKVFTRSYDLKIHLRVHSGNRPYTCDLCSKTFARSDHCIRHLRLKHKASIILKKQ